MLQSNLSYHIVCMYYRRKLLLALLEVLGRPMPRIDLQKMLFLVCAEQAEKHGKSAFEFVPYRYGCYSFQADADKRTLTKYKLLRNSDNWELGRKRGFGHLLEPKDKVLIDDVVHRLGSFRGRKLIQYVYRHYPYYAINSELSDRILNDAEQAAVAAAKPAKSGAGIYTIGYEGKTLECFLNILISRNIRVLCDLRRNALSMKFGFSKRQLASAADKIGVEYVHLPELGIDSAKRRDLDSDDDYRALFDDYRRTTLASSVGSLDRIVELASKHKSVALTCFEATHDRCHRGCVAQELGKRKSLRNKITHL